MKKIDKTACLFIIETSVYDKISNFQRRMVTKVSEIMVNEFGQKPLVDGQNLIKIDAMCVDDDGNDVDDIPPFLLKVK